ncbi:hypothetical protein DEU56DRAFT_734303 [Suillus clintonianus]|uniref:uncharacterized protein n=1 Tax=Suillus clintonianus TaxID=1904413 RepID=UPI001B87D948|nr:uncharacterized protein DEU56DRAFT_734303 [Suillus clintonianus]KAG2141220.1 hypothetical protein DEU56DRAFT_734303 [Suillus clintonianus]
MPSPATPPCAHLALPNCPTSPSKASFSYRIMVGNEISDNTLKACTELFSSNYGIWGEQAAMISKHTVAGKNIKMTRARLRTRCGSHPKNTVLVMCYLQVDPFESPQLYGHAFATVWDYGENKGSRLSQFLAKLALVVDEQVHQCYIATQLLQALKFHVLFSRINIIGLVSSHSTACNALVKYASADIKDIDLDFIRGHTRGILNASPISYLKTAQLRGTLFEDNCDNGAILSVFTEFYVNHAEPLTVLSQYKKRGQWYLGELLDGHEFLAIFPIAPVSLVDAESPVPSVCDLK